MSSSTASSDVTEGAVPAVLSNDQRIAAALRAQFQQSPYSALRRVACDFGEGLAILRGVVPTYHTRQLAIALARSVAGVHAIEDRIQVSAAQRKTK